MAVFEELDWSRLDVWAIVACSGVLTIDSSQRDDVHVWLRSQGYGIDTIDCSHGLGHIIPALSTLFHWQDQFGYSMDAVRWNLNALRDGFAFPVPETGGHVLEMLQPEAAWADSAGSFMGLLSIAQEYSRCEIAQGRRFFAMLVLKPESELIGKAIETSSIPFPFRYKSPPN